MSESKETVELSNRDHVLLSLYKSRVKMVQNIERLALAITASEAALVNLNKIIENAEDV